MDTWTVCVEMDKGLAAASMARAQHSQAQTTIASNSEENDRRSGECKFIAEIRGDI
jgi:hypothetical protein